MSTKNLMQANHLVNLVLPVRNGAATIAAALESVHTQTLSNIHCIFVDDGSTDSTGRILQEWIRTHGQSTRRQSTLLRTSGIGLPHALNLALSHCQGEWIARLDADDLSHPKRFELQLKQAALENANFVGAPVSLIPMEQAQDHAQASHGMQKHVQWCNAQQTHEQLAQARWIDSPLPHPSWFVHHSVFRVLGDYCSSPEIPEDYEFLHRYFEYAEHQAQKSSNWRAVKTSGVEGALVQWRDSHTRLTRCSAAYSTAAFNRVRASYLEKKLNASGVENLIVFGLGPKSKAMFHAMTPSTKRRISAFVEVNVRQVGTRYHGIEVLSVAQWQQINRAQPTKAKPLVLIALGRPQARQAAEQLCAENGLELGSQSISI